MHGTSKELLILSFILAAAFVLMSILNPAQFLSIGNFQSMAFQLPELGILSLAMMITMLTGGINLSIIATANMSGIAAALLLTGGIGTDGVSEIGTVVSALFACLLVSAAIGLVNGLLIAVIGVSPILATLGMMILVNGLTIVITKGYVISGLPDSFLFIGNGIVSGVPVPLMIFIFCAVGMAFILNRTATGFNIYMIGSNPTASFFSGVNNTGVIIRTYVISGLYSGIAALIMIARFNSAKAGYGESYLLITILAAVLGGTSTTGGFGRVSQLILALVILQIISSGLNLLRVNAFLTVAIWGIIILVVMVINFFSEKVHERTRKAIFLKKNVFE